MTNPKHLPECFNGRQRSGGLPCICDRLRACEQRVWKDPLLVASRRAGWNDALVMAREAVERVSTLFEPLGPALAAIDALREKP